MKRKEINKENKKEIEPDDAGKANNEEKEGKVEKAEKIERVGKVGMETEKKDENGDYKKKYIRLLAEFENYKKFREREDERAKGAQIKEFILSILPILDDIEQAMKNTNEKGIKMIYKKINAALEKNGLKKINVKNNDVFNHNIHDAVAYIESELPEGKIIETVKDGYLLNGIIIRHPQVIVSKGKEAKKMNEKNE